VFVIVHSQNNPTDAEWDAVLKDYSIYYNMFRGILVQTAGGAPSAAQREQTTTFWKGKIVPKTAILTSSVVVRAVVTALSWFLPRQRIQAFKDTDLRGALRYLEAENEIASIEGALARLRALL